MQWLLPDWMPTKWLGLFTQPWEGDITLVLPASLWNLGKTMVNPTTEDVVAAARAGELAVWEKLSAVESNCAIEAALDACLARLSNKVGGAVSCVCWGLDARGNAVSLPLEQR
jgi:TAG lipase/steryl ester hydrolase/phospholipase A2/LPA acyltransferase